MLTCLCLQEFVEVASQLDPGEGTTSSLKMDVRSTLPNSAKKLTILSRYLLKLLHVCSPAAWKSHIASIMIYRCVGQALAQSFDPRGSIKEFNWDVLTDGLLTPDDLKMIWFFIEREVSFIIFLALSLSLSIPPSLCTHPSHTCSKVAC